MKKMIIASLAAATPNVFSQEVVLHLKKPNAAEVISVKTSDEKALDWIKKYANFRGFQLELSNSPKSESRTNESELNLFAMELKAELGDAAEVQVVKPSEVQLATQAGGRPGRGGL